jgi:predicted lipoprotein with Yx(FWY)xxD motif
MRLPLVIVYALSAAALGATAAAAPHAEIENGFQATREGYLSVPMPSGFQVEPTELDGPVFADARGRTLYQWPTKTLDKGTAGDPKDSTSVCDNQRLTESVDLIEGYPAGLQLPDLDKRQSCAEVWPPVLASENSKPVGKWTIVDRKDGSKQWTYDGFPLYTSSLDRQPGDVFGATKLMFNDVFAPREPVGPPPNVPAGFRVYQATSGRPLVNSANFSVYYSDRDGPNKSNCDSGCLESWAPVLAPELARSHGEWSVIERSPGVKQWALRKKPLYTHIADRSYRSLEGSDEPGWHNVYMQPMPSPPKGFTIQGTTAGEVLADAHGRTIYIYKCIDDSRDLLGCDHPKATQVYRLAICGAGDPVKCLEMFPPILAPKDAKSDSRSWSVMDIDPHTGHLAAPGQADALHIWVFRDRPVYTYVGDHQPGDVTGDAYGEDRGQRNGYKAFWLRDEFWTNTRNRD